MHLFNTQELGFEMPYCSISNFRLQTVNINKYKTRIADRRDYKMDVQQKKITGLTTQMVWTTGDS